MLVVATFYRFTKIESCKKLKEDLDQITKIHDIFGTILLANEGINGTVCGTRHAMEVMKGYLFEHFYELKYKESFVEKNPFLRRHVKIKKEIVTFDQPQINPQQKTGRHVNTKEWHELLKDSSVVVLDVRNRYETALGTFAGALDPKIDTFKDFPKFVKNNLDPRVHKRIAMSCTGGIRCEKASAYLLEEGFPEVFQLDGGILKYLEDVPQKESHWRGECFVFDHRVTVDHELKPGSYSLCFGCRMPMSAQEKLSPLYIEDVACPNCFHRQTDLKRRAKEIRKKQVARAQTLGKTHLGPQAMDK